jgi:tRNA 2-thiouridine synthesizing protein C
MKKIMIVIYQAPGGTIWPSEGLRLTFGMYGEDIEPEVLFIDQGVIALSKDTEPGKLGLFPLKMCQRYIKKYETQLFAEKESLEKYRVHELDEEFQAQVLSRGEIQEKIRQNDFVIFI